MVVALQKAGFSRKPLSRLALIQEFIDRAEAPHGLSLNIGCKETSIGDVNLDIDGSPDIKSTVLFLPFRDRKSVV